MKEWSGQADFKMIEREWVLGNQPRKNPSVNLVDLLLQFLSLWGCWLWNKSSAHQHPSLSEIKNTWPYQWVCTSTNNIPTWLLSSYCVLLFGSSRTHFLFQTTIHLGYSSAYFENFALPCTLWLKLHWIYKNFAKEWKLNASFHSIFLNGFQKCLVFFQDFFFNVDHF